jgi:hypothetical protein
VRAAPRSVRSFAVGKGPRLAALRERGGARLLCGRFELSDKDKALFHEMHEAVSNQGVQSQAQHAAMLDMFRQMEARLKMQVSSEAAAVPSSADTRPTGSSRLSQS